MACALPVAVAAPASADRCQPEEIVLRILSGDPDEESPITDEETSPVCIVMDGYVYPAVDQASDALCAAAEPAC